MKKKKTSPGYTTKNYPKLPESTKISIFEKVKTTHSSLTTKTMSTDIRFNKKKVNHFQGTTVEKKISKGGKESFQGRKRKFPREENKISSVGNLFFQGWKVFGKPWELLDG